MNKLLKRLAALFAPSSYRDSESREMDAFLSQAQSLAELEHLQCQWERQRSGRAMQIQMSGMR